MGFKRFLKKGGLLGLGVPGHLIDAYKKQKETGKSYTDCLEDSVKETVCEDLPITSHLYSVGKKDGRKQGTAEQAKRDEKKIEVINKQHEEDRENWEKQDQQKDKLIDDLSEQKFGKSEG